MQTRTSRLTSKVLDASSVKVAQFDSVAAPGEMYAALGDMFVVDMADYTLKRFTPDGTFLNGIIRGRGAGPGEVQAPVDFHFDSDSTVWVLDPNPRKILHFERTGAYLGSITIPDLALKMTKSGSEFILLTPMSEKLFLRVDLLGNEIARHTNPLEANASNRLSLTGRLFPLEEGGFLYVPRTAGYFFYYDGDGRLVRTVETIDGAGLPAAARESDGAGGTVRLPDANINVARASLRGSELTLNTSFLGVETPRFNVSLDRYDLESGEYLGSTGVPLESSNVILNELEALVVLPQGVVRVGVRRYTKDD